MKKWEKRDGMKDQYEIHKDITKELLDSIKMGDLVKVNDWKKPLRVKGVSENYFVMATHQFGKCVYSVCEKKPREAGIHNEMMLGKFHVGTDHWIFGAPVWCDFGDESGKYDFDNTEATAAYLATFELPDDFGDIRKSEISERSGIPINTLYIKRVQETEGTE